ncbi:hypothetical protein [Conexibacter sp. CPCC 206217]|uniref:hypothetical protein n=1 Tax=Conexibacter sp. CPCC 206217 TaxID=3064574 RepID=UPI0027214360|nr:hypothetical protein [Conexibacter sp. CPCC 206217]MDO8209286.1 hypothetical protein [Conexibacter sp. CPCC 206217]
MFDSTDDVLRCNRGAADITGDWTFATMLRWRGARLETVYLPHTAGRLAYGYGLEILSGGALYLYAGTPGSGFGYSEVSSPSVHVVRGKWRILAITKRSGSVQADFHSYDFDTRLWKQETAASPSPNCTSIGADGVVTFGKYQSSDTYNYTGELAAAAVWNQALSYETVRSLSQVNALVDWAFVSSPRALWLFDQRRASAPVEDVIGSADQSGTSGASSLAEPAPIPARLATTAVRTTAGWVEHDVSVRTSAGWRRPPTPEIR